ncbi:unnamed protein product, partial [Prorocentrum cordatum]
AEDFKLAAKAAFMPSKAKVAIGVQHRRLIAMAARVTKQRQAVAVDSFLNKSKEELRFPNRAVHVAIGHMWDEVEVKHKWKPSARYRTFEQQVKMPVVVQRATFNTTLFDMARNRAAQYQEYYLAQAVEIDGTKAKDILPAVRQGLPAKFDVLDVENFAKSADNYTSYTYMPCPDRASSNINIIKKFATVIDTQIVREAGHHILFWPDTCGIHAHHRGKMKMKSLRRHTMRQFAIVSMNKYRGRLQRNILGIEAIVKRELTREIGPPPPWAHSMTAVVDLLFNAEDEYHRHQGNESQMLRDLRELCKVANGSLSNDKFIHHCWDFETSRWTNTLINIKRTLLRRLYHKIGLDCFTGTLYASDWDTSNPPDVSIGDEALDDYMKHVFRVRAKKVKEYYESEEMMRELVVFMAILEAADARLLYPMLGDAIRDDGDRSKLDMLLDTDSLIGQFTEDMLGLLNVWDNGDASRRPWMLLDIMKVPMQCQIFSRWARSQILRLSSVMSRRYEVRFSALPYSMYPLSSPRASVAAKRATAERTRALAEHGEMLDCYTRGILRLFPTVNDMLSLKCQMVLNSDFRAHCYGSDQVERLNSEYTARHHVRAPGVKDKESLQEVDVLCSPLLACIERPQLQDADAIAEAAPGTPVAMEIDDAPRGLNPYLLEKNTYMRDAKKAKGSNLTPAEVDAYTKEFKLMWANRDADTYREAYQLWRQNHEGDDQQQPGETDIPKYEQIWGGGEPSTPLTAQEMHGYVSEHGWPSDAEVQDRDMSERRIASDATVTFDSDEVANADPWGTGRSARNIPRAWARVPQAMDIIEKGIFNWFLSLGAERADASDIMLVAEGPLADGGGFQRKVAIVSDVTYNPRVFDVVANSFVQEDLATSE